MITQTRNYSIFILSPFSLLTARSGEVIYDDEQQLAAEFAAAFSKNHFTQPLPEIDPDDFEKLYTWFLS